MDTTNKRLKNPNFNPHGGKKFTKEYQPTGIAKSLGIRKKNTLHDLLNLTLKGKDKDIVKARQLIAGLYNISVKEAEEFTFEEYINTTQLKRAALKSDAWKVLMERVYGAPTQTLNERVNIKVIISPPRVPTLQNNTIDIKDYTLIEQPKETDNENL